MAALKKNYIKNGNFLNFLETKSDSKYTKTHQIGLFKILSRGNALNPLALRHADFQI